MALGRTEVKKVILSPFYSGIDQIGGQDVKYYKSDDVHSKLYCLTEGGKSTLWIGSANCTVSGLRRNYECMVGVHYDEDITEPLEAWLREKKISPIEALSVLQTKEERGSVEQLIATHTFRLAIRKVKAHYTLTL